MIVEVGSEIEQLVFEIRARPTGAAAIGFLQNTALILGGEASADGLGNHLRIRDRLRIPGGDAHRRARAGWPAVGGGEKLVHFGGLLDPRRGKHFRPASGVKAERSEPAGLGLDATG